MINLTVDLKVKHGSGLTVGVGFVEQNETTLVQGLVDGFQIRYVQVDFVDDLKSIFVVARNVRLIVDVVGQIFGVNGLVTAPGQAVMLEPVDQHWHGVAARLDLAQHFVLIVATSQQNGLAQSAGHIRNGLGV